MSYKVLYNIYFNMVWQWWCHWKCIGILFRMVCKSLASREFEHFIVLPIICGMPTVTIVIRADTVLSINNRQTYKRRPNESGLTQIYVRETVNNINVNYALFLFQYSTGPY